MRLRLGAHVRCNEALNRTHELSVSSVHTAGPMALNDTGIYEPARRYIALGYT